MAALLRSSCILRGAHGQLVGERSWPERGHHIHQDEVRSEVLDLHGDGTEPINENSKGFSLFLFEVEEGDCGEIMPSACIKLGGEGSGERGEGVDSVGGRLINHSRADPLRATENDLHNTASSVE